MTFSPKPAIFFLLCALFNAHAHSQSFFIDTQTVETADYLKPCGENCPEIDYRLITTPHPWLDSIINKAVVSDLNVSSEENSAAEKIWKNFAALKNPDKAQLTQQLNFALAAFVKESMRAQKENNSTIAYSVSSKPTYLGHKTLATGNDLELFSIVGDQYTGGAHGLPWVHYYVFDIATRQQLKLDDIVLPNQKAALERLTKDAYIDYLKKNDMNPTEMLESWKFFLTDNFIFTQNGINLLYQPYDITPFAMGMPEFTIPYSKLNGIIKPIYLK